MSRLPGLHQMLQQLIERPSVSSTRAALDQSNREVIELIANWCEDLGMQVSTMALPEDPAKWNLVARVGPGQGGLAFSGHTDTVPYDEGLWQMDPFTLTERDGRWYGLGICDMKSFFALSLLALEKALPQLTRPVSLIATADEESGMAGAKALFQQASVDADYVVVGEPTGMRPVYQHKGILMEEIVVDGRSGHSSNPALGRSALEAMTDMILELRGLREEWQQRYRTPGFEVPTPTLNLGCIHGGDNPNRICQSCRLQFDVRVTPGLELGMVREALQQRLQPVAQRHDVTLQFNPVFSGVESFYQSPDSDLVRLCHQATGQQPGSVAFATEAPFFLAGGAQTVILGPGDIDQAHQPDEFLARDRVEPALKVLEKLIRQLCTDNLGSVSV